MTVGLATFLNFGFSVYYTKSLKPKDILNTIQDKKINFMILVPAFLRLLKNVMEAEIKKTLSEKKYVDNKLKFSWLPDLLQKMNFEFLFSK